MRSCYVMKMASSFIAANFFLNSVHIIDPGQRIHQKSREEARAKSGVTVSCCRCSSDQFAEADAHVQSC